MRSIRQGPLGRLSIGGGEGGIDGVRSTNSEGGDGTGEGSAGAAGALAARSVGGIRISGTGGEGKARVLRELQNCGPQTVVDSAGCPGFAVLP